MPAKMLDRRSLMAGMFGVLAARGNARAHGMHAAFTVIEENRRTGSLEIIHRLFVQDLELLLTARVGERVTLQESPGMEKAVEGYLLDVFSIKTPAGAALKPAWVGMKLQLDTVFVYQELNTTADLTGLVVNSQILTETHPGQVNSVNVTAKGHTQTLIFMANDPAQVVMF
jgi:hypothetical protein